MTTRLTQQKRIALAAAGAVLALATSLSLGAGSATAVQAESETESATASTVTVPLTLVGYDRKIAERNGFKIVLGPDGRERSVPVTAAARKVVAEYGADMPSLDASGRGTVIGNCGQASLDGYAIGSRRSTILTGFKVKAPAYSFRWSIAVTDQGGSFTKTWGPAALASRTSWAATHTWTAGARGSAFGQVRTGYFTSYAALINGGWCTAGAASDAWTVTG